MDADGTSFAERGLAACVFAMAPFLGPTIGPIVGGFLVSHPASSTVQFKSPPVD